MNEQIEQAEREGERDYFPLNPSVNVTFGQKRDRRYSKEDVIDHSKSPTDQSPNSVERESILQSRFPTNAQ